MEGFDDKTGTPPATAAEGESILCNIKSSEAIRRLCCSMVSEDNKAPTAVRIEAELQPARLAPTIAVVADQTVKSPTLSLGTRMGSLLSGEPGSFDVLCGRGRAIQEHPGNQILRQVVDLQSKKYHGANRKDKRATAEEIVKAMQANGNRFLKQDNEAECWEEVDNEVAKDKVCHCFRSRSRVLKSSSTATSGEDLPAYRLGNVDHIIDRSHQLPIVKLQASGFPPTLASHSDPSYIPPPARFSSMAADTRWFSPSSPHDDTLSDSQAFWQRDHS
jgi:hypothetical protein